MRQAADPWAGLVAQHTKTQVLESSDWSHTGHLLDVSALTLFERIVEKKGDLWLVPKAELLRTEP